MTNILTGSKLSGNENSRLITSGLKKHTQTVPNPNSVACSIMWSVKIAASISVVCLLSKGRFHACEWSAQTMKVREHYGK